MRLSGAMGKPKLPPTTWKICKYHPDSYVLASPFLPLPSTGPLCSSHKLLMPNDAMDNSKRTLHDVMLSMGSISTGGYCSNGWWQPKFSSPSKWRSSLAPKFVMQLFSWASGQYFGFLEYNSNFFFKLNSSFPFFLQNIQGLTRNLLE